MDEESSPPVDAVLVRWLRAGPHDTLLAVGDTAASLLADASVGAAVTELTRGASLAGQVPQSWLQALARQQRFDAALVSDIGARLTDTDAATLLAALRDRHARRLLLLANATQSSAGLLALGLRRLGPVLLADRGSAQAWEYDVATYKRTPDWLNARHWANPELWGRYRW